jgi:3-oxoacyl-[acyl-carrier protein] reductase
LCHLGSAPFREPSSAAGNIGRRKVDISALLGRMGQPDDIAPTAVYLASSDSKYMTGEMLLVSGCPL